LISQHNQPSGGETTNQGVVGSNPASRAILEGGVRGI
jgi:hypothetical protein